MQNLTDLMKQLPRRNEFFIGFDSDGCVFDTMEVKQKECFCPAFVQHFQMQCADKYAREVWEFVNLYSKTRGCNRFPALSRALALLAKRPEIQKRQVQLFDTTELDRWIAQESKLGNAALEHYIANGHDTPGFRQIMQWSRNVNERIAELVHGVPPFPGVRETLAEAKKHADLIVISQTPLEALEREWQEHQIDGFVDMICAQEHGTKTEHIRYTTQGKYAQNHILMVGDAPGDYKAAQANQVLFFPIIPGQEDASWEALQHEGLERFFDQKFEGAYQASLLDAFDHSLPEAPPWQSA